MEHYKNLNLDDIVYLCKIDNIKKIERWKQIKDYPDYSISDLGRVKSFKDIKCIIKKLCDDGRGYLQVRLSDGIKTRTIKVHKLVAINFLNHTPCGHKLVINHKDIDKTNNYVLNLEIITNRENCNRKHIKSTSKYVGVFWCKRLNKWLSNIRIKNRTTHLGCFINEYDAHLAYQKKLKEIS